MKLFILVLSFLSLSISFAKSSELSVGITTSGGVSLGTYEAGFHYYLAEYNKVNKEKFKKDFKGINYYTGASAGAANSVMSIFSACSSKRIPISESPLWKFWTKMSINKLLRPEDTTAISLLSPSYVLEEVYPKFRETWSKGFPKDCDVVLGLAVTRLDPTFIEWEGTVEIPRLAEHYIFRIKGQGKGVPPVVENYLLPGHENFQILYPFTKDQNKNFEGILDILQASTAFPLAFPPVLLPYCYIKKGGVCTPENATAAKFIDGGVFDNIPLNLLQKIQDHHENKYYKKNNKTKAIFYVSPYSEAFMKEKSTSSKELKKGYDAQDHVMKVFLHFVDSARKSEIRSYQREEGDFLVPSVRYFPLASSPMFAFFGFLEKDFRLYDFYLGMVDARVLLKQHIENTEMLTAEFPEKDYFNDSKWTPFYCIASFLGDKQYLQHCLEQIGKDKESVYNFSVLFKVSLVKLYNKCKEKKENLRHPTCDNFAKDKNALTSVIEVEYTDELKQTALESDAQYTLRLLQKFKFEFKDLDIPIEKNEYAPYLIQKKFNEVVTSFTEKQNEGNQRTIDFALTNALSTLAIKQYESTFYAEFGTGIEVGYSNTLSLNKYSDGFTKYSFSLLSFSTSNYFSNKNRAVSLAPMVGVHQAIRSWSSTNIFHSYGINAGYQLSNGDRYGRGDCTPENYNDDVSSCSGLNFQPSYMIVLFQRLRIKMYGHYLLRDTRSNSFNVGLQLGLNFGGEY